MEDEKLVRIEKGGAGRPCAACSADGAPSLAQAQGNVSGPAANPAPRLPGAAGFALSSSLSPMTPAMNTPEFSRPLFQPQRTDPCFCGSGRRFKSCCGSLAEPREPPHGVHVVPGFLDPETCAGWVHRFEQRPRTPLAVHALDDRQPAGLAKESTRGRITDKVDLGEWRNTVVDTVRSAFENEVPAAFGRRIEWFENPQVLRYEPGGLYGPHADSEHFMPSEGCWRKVIDRDISILLYLNEDFTGGELSFRQFNYRYRPRTGDLLFFPSHGQYAHQALPVGSGVRYVVVSWAAWRDEPRVLKLRPSESIYLEP